MLWVIGHRIAGSKGGKGVWALARQYFDGSIAQVPFGLTIQLLDPGACELRFDTLRGFFYKLQTSSNLFQTFADSPAGFVQAVDTSLVITDNVAQPGRFYRVVRTGAP